MILTDQYSHFLKEVIGHLNTVFDVQSLESLEKRIVRLKFGNLIRIQIHLQIQETRGDSSVGSMQKEFLSEQGLESQ
jgi:hypothetical protein